MTLLDRYLTSVKARAAAATPGPIRRLDNDDPAMIGDDAFTIRLQVYGPRHNADAEFYAAARTDVPRLVAMLQVCLDAINGSGDEHMPTCVRFELDRLAAGDEP